MILPEYCETVCSALKQIRSVPVDVERIAVTDLKVKAQTVKEVRWSRTVRAGLSVFVSLIHFIASDSMIYH